jgi:hypothetical protein
MGAGTGAVTLTTSSWDHLPPVLPTRREKIRAWWTPARVIGAGLLLLGVFGAAQEALPYFGVLAVFFQNISAELFGIGFTILVIDVANERRTTQERKAQLILQMSSPERAFAIEAARILRKENWLMDGTLHHADLSGANLEKAFLKDADLERANFASVNLREANFVNADLRNVFFFQANLEQAALFNVLLQGAMLTGANLHWAYLEGAQFDVLTILPDGEFWTPQTDMRQFTHPEEWVAEQRQL